MPYKNEHLNELQKLLTTWIGAISGTSKNLIFIDATIFQTKEEKFSQMFGELLKHFEIQNIHVQTHAPSEKIVEEVQKISGVGIELAIQEESFAGCKVISLDGHGFQMKEAMKEILQGKKSTIHFMEKEEIVNELINL